MNRFLILFCAFCCGVPGGRAAQTPTEKEAGDRLARHTGIRSAIDAAEQEGALVLVVFGADWCAPCVRLKKQVLTNPDFEQKVGRLVLVHIDVDREPKTAGDYGVRAIPDLVLMTAEKKIVSRHRGFIETEPLLDWIRQGARRAEKGMWLGIAADGLDWQKKLDSKDLKSLVESLGRQDPQERRRIISALVARRERSMEPLIEGLGHDYLGVRVGSREAIRRLTDTLPDFDPWASPGVRREQLEKVRVWWSKNPRLPAVSRARKLGPSQRRSVRESIQKVLSDDAVAKTRGMAELVDTGVSALPHVRKAIAKRRSLGDHRSLGPLEDVRWAILVPDELELKLKVRRDLARGTSRQRQLAADRLAGAGERALPALGELIND
ncbi:MAG: thioredoxin family protein, partial [Phycisphaeraceae bacterium]|nr:thioredoxin family protein [Phycisphaeraceae bacterium]